MLTGICITGFELIQKRANLKKVCFLNFCIRHVQVGHEYCYMLTIRILSGRNISKGMIGDLSKSILCCWLFFSHGLSTVLQSAYFC